MDDAYVEYLELFEYFGRGGLERLGREEFEALSLEFDQLVALKPNWTQVQLRRVLALRQVLLRDRPRLHELIPRQ